MIKIAIYSGAVPSTIFIEYLVKNIADAGYKVLLFGRKQSKINYNNSNIKLYTTPGNKFVIVLFVLWNSIKLLILHPKKFSLLYKKVRSIQQRNELMLNKLGTYLPILLHPVDIFHFQWAKSLVAMEYILELLDSKIVLSLRGAHIDYSPIVDKKLAVDYRRIFPNINHFHAVSLAIANESLKYNAELSKITIINPAVDKSLLQYSSPVYAKEENVLRIISVGRLHWKKGYNYALDAISQLKQSGVKIQYTIIASGDIEEYIFQIHDLDLVNDVKLIDYLPHNEVIEALKQNHLFLLSSVEEGIANVVLEAMAVGLPVISTNCGGMEEVIEHNSNGWIVPIRDSKAISEAVIRFTNTHEAEIDNVIKSAKKTIKEKHLLTLQTVKFKKLYQDLV